MMVNDDGVGGGDGSDGDGDGSDGDHVFLTSDPFFPSPLLPFL